jgi:hypothetical protein
MFLGWVFNPTPTPSNTGGSMILCQGFLLYLTGAHFKASRTRSPPLHDLAVYRLPTDHGGDMHAEDLVGILSISCVLLVRIRLQEAYPQYHILPLWPDFITLSLSLRRLSPRANYTDRATDACRRRTSYHTYLKVRNNITWSNIINKYIVQLLFCYYYTVLFLFQHSSQVTGWQNTARKWN